MRKGRPIRGGRDGLALAVLAIAAVALAAACESDRLLIDGRGVGVSVEFRIEGGAYLVQWSAEDPGEPGHGCLFGLTVEQTDADIKLDHGETITFAPRKLAYVSLPASGLAGGAKDGLVLAAGSYRLRSEGSCAWKAEVLPGHPDPTDPPGIEQQG